MIKTIFETSVPGILSQEEIIRRIHLWRLAGITEVQISVNDGRGSTWISNEVPVDPRSTTTALRKYTELVRSYGIRIVLVFDIIGPFYDTRPIKPEFLLDRNTISVPTYNIWNPAMVDWRVRQIMECLDQVYCDEVAVDMIRTGREVLTETVSAKDAVYAALEKLRTAIEYPLRSVSNAVFLNSSSIQQGIDIKTWYKDGLVDEVELFFYHPRPWPDLSGIPQEKMHTLGSSYNYPQTTVVSLPALQVQRQKVRLLRTYPDLKSYGLFTANWLSEDQANLISKW